MARMMTPTSEPATIPMTVPVEGPEEESPDLAREVEVLVEEREERPVVPVPKAWVPPETTTRAVDVSAVTTAVVVRARVVLWVRSRY